MATPDDYTTHLAARVLNDNAIMTYRLLSRELKVNVNRAKEMLYTFHQNTNSNKPGSCHATYLVSGYQPWPEPDANSAEATPSKDGEEDTVMMSSPFELSQQATQPDSEVSDKPGKMHVVVTPEEQLEAVKKSFVQITSIHVYSIESAELKDLTVLSNASKEVIMKYSDDAPDYRSQTYGTTFNQLAKRRPGKKIPMGAPNVHSSKYVVPVAKAEPKKEVAVDKKDFFAGAKKKDAGKKDAVVAEADTSKEVKKETPAATPASSSAAKAAPKRGGQSNIMSSFGKAQPKKPKPEPVREDSMDVDKPMFSEDEDDGNEEEPEEEEPVVAPSNRKTRKQKEEELKQMMEEESDEEPKKVAQKHKRKSTESIKDEEPQEKKVETSADEDASSPPKSTAAAASAAPGKRRGKRQVKKRITTKDESGFLVTKHETVWESFSEDETEPSKSTALSSKPASSGSSSQKGKKPTGGGGKSGNIMSFFGKK